jgi:hypothetical protein
MQIQDQGTPSDVRFLERGGHYLSYLKSDGSAGAGRYTDSWHWMDGRRQCVSAHVSARSASSDLLWSSWPCKKYPSLPQQMLSLR